MKKLLALLLFSLMLFMGGCNLPTTSPSNLEKNKLYVEYDEQIPYTQSGKIKVTSTYENDTVKIVSRNVGILKIDRTAEDDMIAKAVTPGVATIVVTNSYEEHIEFEIEVIETEEYSPINDFSFSFVEDGPYYMGQTYHLNLEVLPNNYVEDEYDFIKSDLYDFDKKTMEITFEHTGVFEIQVKSKVKGITKTFTMEIGTNPNQESYHILFLGNSLTYVHDIPQIIKNMITADGSYINYIEIVEGGAALIDHKDKFDENITNYTFTHVILQEQSFGPINDYIGFRDAVKYYGDIVNETDAELLLYQTWGYNIDGTYRGYTKYEMQDALQIAYDEAASIVNADVSRVGEAFEIYETEYENLPTLYQDMNHQSIYGAYLSACVHYVMITGKSASLNTYLIPDIPEEVITIIRNIADRVALDSE